MSQFNLPTITPKKGLIVVGLLLLVIIAFGGVRPMHSGVLGISGGTMSVASMPMNQGFAIATDSYGEKGMMVRDVNVVYGRGGGVMPPVPQPSDAPAGEAKIIKNATLGLLVDDVDQAAEKIATIRDQVGGQIGNSSFNNYNTGSRTGNITIWVPAKRFDEAVSLIKKIAIRVTNENVGVSDVSAQFVDLEARLKNLRATEAQYQEILKRSGKISDVLEVTRELSNTRAQIEQMQGQINYLSRQVDMSSISIALSQEASPAELSNDWRPIATIKAAAKDALRGFTQFADSLLVLIVMLPLLLVKLAFWALLLYGIWRVGRFVYRRINTALPTGTGKV